MEQLICCSIKVQPARSGSKHLAAALVFARLRRPNGVNFNLTAHPCFMKVQPARSGPRHLAAPRKEFPHRSALPGSEAGVCPPPAAKRREPPFDGCVPSNECSASPEWPEALAAPRKSLSHRSASPGSKANPVPASAAPRCASPVSRRRTRYPGTGNPC